MNKEKEELVKERFKEKNKEDEKFVSQIIYSYDSEECAEGIYCMVCWEKEKQSFKTKQNKQKKKTSSNKSQIAERRLKKE